jgi:dTDP-glucose 4,6-dehydratase
MKTILVTGGAGFIGSNFISYMYKKYSKMKFLVLDSLTYAGNIENFNTLIRNDPRFEFWYGDVRNADIVGDLVEKADTIVHFAAETHVARSIFNNKIFFQTDVLGTQTVLNAVLKRNKSAIDRVIHISTSEVYGSAEEYPMTERHALMPCSPYASAKAGADRLAFSYWKTYGLPIIIVSPFNNYGPYQHLEKVIPRFITSAILNKPLTIHGDGTASRDWIYVKDHCKALEAIVNYNNGNLFGKAINIGTGVNIDIKTIAEMILTKMNRPMDLIEHIYNRPGQVECHVACTKLAKKTLKWKAETDFEEGLERTINWYLENQKWWEPIRWMRQIPIKRKDGEIVMH